jgi:MtN3 and saliva related transmembrane protein
VSVETLLSGSAALCSTVSFAPQAIKIIRTRNTKDISFWMYLLTVGAFALWTSYGAMTAQWALVASNSICLALAGFILVMKILPDRKKRRRDRTRRSRR